MVFQFFLLLENLGADVALERVYANVVNDSHVVFQMIIVSTDFGTNLAPEGTNITQTMDCGQVSL